MKVRKNVGDKWGKVTAASGEYYNQGIQNPRADWKTATLAAENNQALGAQQAITEKRFAKGVNKAGSAKWLKGAQEKGVQRFPAGVQAGQGNFEAGIAPYLATIESLVLPNRYPKGDPRNLDRVKAITVALRAKKVSG